MGAILMLTLLCWGCVCTCTPPHHPSKTAPHKKLNLAPNKFRWITADVNICRILVLTWSWHTCVHTKWELTCTHIFLKTCYDPNYLHTWFPRVWKWCPGEKQNLFQKLYKLLKTLCHGLGCQLSITAVCDEMRLLTSEISATCACFFVRRMLSTQFAFHTVLNCLQCWLCEMHKLMCMHTNGQQRNIVG
jgi:hypothetical protein